MKYYILLFSISLFFSSCNRDNCESEKVGDVALSTESKRFVPYEEGDIIELVNENGDLLQLQNKIDRSPASICTKYICELFSDPFATGHCEYIEAESIRNVLISSDQNLLVDILVSFEQYEEESDRAYEFFRVSASSDGFTVAPSYFITQVNFQDIPFDENTLSIDNRLEEVENIELLGRTFSNVFVSEEQDNRVYYQADKGLIGLRINTVLWLIKD